MSDLKTLPNIGKVIAGKLQEIEINSAEDFLKLDPYKVFDELIDRVDSTLCRCALASIVGASKGEKWNLVMKEAVAKYEKDHPTHKWEKC